MVPYRFRRAVLTIISVILLTYSLVKIGIWVKENSESKAIEADYIEQAFMTVESSYTDENGESQTDGETLKLDMEFLKSKNDSTRGWIKVDDTNINYPVVQANDNDYYLEHKKELNWDYLFKSENQ